MAQTPRPVVAEDLLKLKTIADVQLSPDGRRVAYTLSEIDAEADDYRTSVWLLRMDGDDAPPQRLTQGSRKDSAPRWSPDGRSLAFLSDRDGGAPQLYLLPLEPGGEARRLTTLDKGAGPAVWSPDGTQIAFEARVLKETPPQDKEARARWDQRPRVITRAQYKTDGQGYTFDATSCIFVLSPAGDTPRQLTNGESEDRSPAWSPDSRAIAFTRTRTGEADYSLGDLWVMDAAGQSPAGPAGQSPAGPAGDGVGEGSARRLTEDVGRVNVPSWSPDGRQIAFYGTERQEPGFGEHMVRLWTVPSDGQSPARVPGSAIGPGFPVPPPVRGTGRGWDGAGGAPHCLTADFDRAVYVPVPPAPPLPAVWSADGRTLTFPVATAGCIHLVRLAAEGGAVHPVVTGERWLTAASAAPAAGRLAFVATAPDSPGEAYVCAWDGSEERRLTAVNQELLSQVALPRAERRRFRSPHGGQLDGWVTLPAGGGPAPLLVLIHGGPHSFAGSKFEGTAFFSYTLAARGWAVLALNPTGSGSYGREFAHSIRTRWGEHDLPEQLAAVDALVAEGLADPQRLAVTGYSYGGYMTSWIVGHTGRFKAAVVGAPLTNFESFHGTSDIGPWFSPWELRGDIVAARELYRRLSPINYVDQVTTPTLILHGEADERCPIGQGEELYAGLVAAGRAPAAFVRYPGGFHGFVTSGRPSHRVDYTQRVTAWLEQHVL